MIQENLQLIISFLTLGGIIFAVYKNFEKPDIKAATEIELLKQGCKLKHANIDENIIMIKNNHLTHIEADIKELKEDMIEIKTILKERFK